MRGFNLSEDCTATTLIAYYLHLCTLTNLSIIHPPRSDRIRTAVNVLSDGYVAGIVAHLSKDELAKYDAEHGGQHPELQGIQLDSGEY